MATIQSTTVTPAGDGGNRVKIAIADNADIDHATEVISVMVPVRRLSENPSLTDLQIAALQHAQRLISHCIAELAPKVSAD